MNTSTISRIALTAACGALVATPVVAEKADRLTTLVGLEAAGAESSLRSRGFEHIETHHSGSSTWSYWWDEETDDCVRVEEYGGQVTSITDTRDRDCGHHKGNAEAAVAAVAGAALLGALFSHKSHHYGDDEAPTKEEESAEFERGYQHGLHNAPYHNYNRSDFYSRGYSAGVEERQAKLRHHPRRGGYQAAVGFSDLEGARAAGGMSEMERRGFRQVDNFTSGNTRYSIQWNRNTRQCVQVTIADGRFYALNDIQTHPKCR